MRKLKPQQYLDEFYTGVDMTTKTVTNWIKQGKIAGMQTPTGRWLVLVEDEETDKVVIDSLLAKLEL
ncbi:hypothetical protein AB6E53_02500 [Vibrio breoganii]|uniref:Uncharacterized protein n=1 Tax=Vibrio breoganii TaxID=553239 RepID=A0AAP8SWZ4_9VIBR|nr:hypothetical protein [Vibrio breoganii]PMP10257.1 hypothetical protein BCS93_11315 [Vibrio breoganii]